MAAHFQGASEPTRAANQNHVFRLFALWDRTTTPQDHLKLSNLFLAGVPSITCSTSLPVTLQRAWSYFAKRIPINGLIPPNSWATSVHVSVPAATELWEK